jgi:hypothetical protein
MDTSEVVIVAQPEDPVAVGVQQMVAASGGGVAWYAPSALATLNVELTGEMFNVDGRAVRTVLWRVSPEMPLAEDFQVVDRAFAGAEVAATWLAALRTNGIVAINRFDAEAWYSGLRPQYWRDRLSAAGIAVTSMSVGDCPVPEDWQWSPYTTGEPSELPEPKARAVMASACHAEKDLVTSVYVCGQIITECPDPNVHLATELLDAWGVGLAAIEADTDGRLHRVRVLPVFDDASLLERVTTILGTHLYDNCTARRS